MKAIPRKDGQCVECLKIRRKKRLFQHLNIRSNLHLPGCNLSDIPSNKQPKTNFCTDLSEQETEIIQRITVNDSLAIMISRISDEFLPPCQ